MTSSEEDHERRAAPPAYTATTPESRHRRRAKDDEKKFLGQLGTESPPFLAAVISTPGGRWASLGLSGSPSDRLALRELEEAESVCDCDPLMLEDERLVGVVLSSWSFLHGQGDSFAHILTSWLRSNHRGAANIGAVRYRFGSCARLKDPVLMPEGWKSWDALGTSSFVRES